MIYGRDIKGYHWQVFQHGHTGWWWTDGRGVVSRESYPNKKDAEEAMEEVRGR